MTVEQKIKKVLQTLGYPVAVGEYIGAADTYFVFNISDVGLAYGDDCPAVDLCLIQIHLYCPTTVNPATMIRNARRLLLEEVGTTWPDLPIGSVVEGKIRHSVLECEVEVDADGCL